MAEPRNFDGFEELDPAEMARVTGGSFISDFIKALTGVVGFDTPPGRTIGALASGQAVVPPETTPPPHP